MTEDRFLRKYRIAHSSIKKDILYFAIPGVIVLGAGLFVSFSNWGSGVVFTAWELIEQPQNLFLLSIQSIIGLAQIIVGFPIILVGQITLYRQYSATVIIREGHQLVTHGIYRFVRNPMYLGVILFMLGMPMYAESLAGFLILLLLIPIFLIRIHLEEALLLREFGDEYLEYKKSAKKLIPFIY